MIAASGPDLSIYVVLEDGKLIAINKDGRLIWEFALTRGEQLPPVVLSTGLIIASDTTGRVVGLTHRGYKVWEIDLGESVSAAPVLDYSRRLVFGTARGNLHALDSAGIVLAKRYIGDVPSVIAPYQDGLLVGTTSGRLIRLGTDDDPKWRTDLGSAVADLVIDEQNQSYALLDDGSLAHVSASGVVTWRANPTPARIASVTAANGALVTITGGSLTHLSPDGSLSWQLGLPSNPVILFISSPTVTRTSLAVN